MVKQYSNCLWPLSRSWMPLKEEDWDKTVERKNMNEQQQCPLSRNPLSFEIRRAQRLSRDITIEVKHTKVVSHLDKMNITFLTKAWRYAHIWTRILDTGEGMKLRNHYLFYLIVKVSSSPVFIWNWQVTNTESCAIQERQTDSCLVYQTELWESVNLKSSESILQTSLKAKTSICPDILVVWNVQD